MKMEPKLLTRDQFREGVFARDNHKCVVCGEPAADAHHILERRLFDNGGYFLENGASVCEKHHLECEMTLISVEQIREYAGITRRVVPEHMYEDHIYDKWGNTVLENGTRTKGELFNDPSVQKILGLGGVLPLFTNYVKYPRTMHVPWSPGIHDDDRARKDMSDFEGRRVIVTEKMDGENTSVYADYFHARSIDGRSHPSRAWAKSFAANWQHELPEGWRIVGENVYAQHSIVYNDLETYFYGISIWNADNVCLSWDDTQEWFNLLGITPVPVLYRGVYAESYLKQLYDEKRDRDRSEGWVIRLEDSFNYGAFRRSVAKYVRAGHVQTTKHHWQSQRVIPNVLKGRGVEFDYGDEPE